MNSMNDGNPGSNVKDTADAVRGIVEAVPIYEDLLQPATQELGKGLHTLSKLVNIALAPVSGLVWGYDKIAEYMQVSMEEKLKDTPKEDIITPDPSIAVPTVETLRYTAHNEELRDMFSNLLATAMDRTKAAKAHPSFVEIIRQISPDEAKILKVLDGKSPSPLVKLRLYDPNTNHFAEPLINFSALPYEVVCSNPELGPSYMENITRLGLTNISYSTYSVNPNAYDSIYSHHIINEWKLVAEERGKRFEVNQGALTRTAFGQKFFEACILSS
jgi:Abortive infection alpha